MARKKTTVRKVGAGAATGVAVGAGLAALAAAAGVYFLYGSKDAKKNRKQVRGWALRAKGEVLEAIEKMPHIDEKKYRALVDQVSKRYRGVKQVSPAEIAALTRELKGHWRSIRQHLGAASTDVTRSAKRVGKKVVRAVKKPASRSRKPARKAKRRTSGR